ncbi:MAG TPA: AAA family ATPase [Kofleriaceae bacterium]|nr:AAA family ATPase [Kofleriaceae bacterium]
MQAAISLSIPQIQEFLLNVATTRPVFIWGAPGIGKSSLVEQFAKQLSMECVTLLGSQLAPEDLIGIPGIRCCRLSATATAMSAGSIRLR